MIELTKQTILDLCNLEACVEVNVDEKPNRATIMIELTGKAARVVCEWSEENIRRDNLEMRQELARIKREAKRGAPWAKEIVAARRDLEARKPLTIEQCALLSMTRRLPEVVQARAAAHAE